MGWEGNHSFYMLSGFNLVRAIIHQFTEVANRMSVCFSVGVQFGQMLKRSKLKHTLGLSLFLPCMS